ncbi:LOW QUALITY PROTEIN: hypothetical protein HID58_086817, partial [Brassica napus]
VSSLNLCHRGGASTLQSARATSQHRWPKEISYLRERERSDGPGPRNCGEAVRKGGFGVQLTEAFLAEFYLPSMEAIRVSERRLYHRIYAGSSVSHSMIRTPLPSGEAPKNWVGEKPLLSVSTFFQHCYMQTITISDSQGCYCIESVAASPPPPRSSIYGKDEQMAKTDMAVSSSATLADSQCMEAAEIIRAEKEHLASVVRTAISVRCARDIMTLTACVPQRSGDIESEGYERILEHCISIIVIKNSLLLKDAATLVIVAMETRVVVINGLQEAVNFSNVLAKFLDIFPNALLLLEVISAGK